MKELRRKLWCICEELTSNLVSSNVEDPDVACYRIALENEQNHNAIMMAIIQKEYNVLESTGSVMVYEGVDFVTIFDKVKKQIQEILG